MYLSKGGNMPIKKITRIALLSAILYVSKVALEWIPNVELVSFLTIIYTLIFGREAFLIVTVFNLFEFLQWGFGVWWVSYLYVWPLLVLLTLMFKKLLGEEFILWGIVSGVFGLIFGSLFAIAYIPLDPSYAFSYWIAGLLWDVWHGACNFVLMLFIGKPVYKAIKKVVKMENLTKN